MASTWSSRADPLHPGSSGTVELTSPLLFGAGSAPTEVHMSRMGHPGACSLTVSGVLDLFDLLSPLLSRGLRGGWTP